MRAQLRAEHRAGAASDEFAGDERENRPPPRTAHVELADSTRTPEELIDELYLATLSRFPDEKEQALLLSAFEDSAGDRRKAAEDILWALLNSKDFMFNH